MAEPLRKETAFLEPEPSLGADPFRYGSRWMRVRLPSGEVIVQQIPLTVNDLLDPQLGDEVTQSDPHFTLVHLVVDLFRRFYESRQDVFVSSDLKMLWGIPGLQEPSPDIAVIPGVRKKVDPDRSSFDVVREGTRPCLIIEVASSLDAEVRRNDYDKKVRIYQRARIPEYVILDPPSSATQGRFLYLGYRLGSNGLYHPMEPDSQGRLLSETTGLLFFVDETSSLRVMDTVTGMLLRSGDDETQARKAAEERAALEAKAREAAEAEVARLRAELARTR